ncbi:alpha/beta fold hydrolase [Actinokineospora spheciospongiae]|uniref:alpha/beta fold hydrolase n=1 Tax=Actinokineospora spheciospongiae TaxID=909613 RepID=UPI000D716D95|nr:alpha/beta hydrolase [Actinokineospora spheciospongiae]PWW65307.1 lipase [Actinokineospora spheciospongiae]
MSVYAFGSPAAPPVLLVHGVSGHGRRFEEFAAAELPGFRVIAPDLRGHGDGPRVPPWTLEQLADDLLAVLDSVGLHAAPVVAHSYGALVALHLAALAPDRVSGLVLLDPATGVDPQQALTWAEASAVVREDRASAVGTQRHDWPRASDAAIEREVEQNWAQGADGRWRPRYSPAAVATAWSEMCRPVPLPPPGTPTLLVEAAREDFVGAQFPRACSALDSFEHTRLDAGHMLHLDAPQELGALLRGFLAAKGFAG